MKGSKRPTIPEIYAQMLFIGPKYNAAKAKNNWGAPKHTGGVDALQRSLSANSDTFIHFGRETCA